MVLSRDNHFVSQAYLRNWSEDGHTIQAYRILVSHPNVREWSLREIRGLAFRRDLYTRVDPEGNESDKLERWIADEIESPALASISKAVNGKRLSPDDWRQMALFFAAQDLRTPSNFLECMERWKKDLPTLIQKTLRESVERLKEAKRKGYKIPSVPPEEPPAGLKVHVRRSQDGSGRVYASVTAGRAMWLQEMRRLLGGIAKGLTRHKWSIAYPAKDYEWITSDHPALKLNYYNSGSYDFGGGWASRGTELMLPLSPRHLLYTQIGKKAAPRFEFSLEKTRELQLLLATRAYRWIFARHPVAYMSSLRPRIVDHEAFESEERSWQEWHEEQSASEARDLIDDADARSLDDQSS